MRETGMSYDEYERKRQELLKDDQPATRVTR
jgi:hypothetical protein